MKRILFLIIVLYAFYACEEVYEDPPQALVEAMFIDTKTNQPIYSMVSVKGIGQETNWVNDTLVKGMILPLSPDTITRFSISFDSKTDTLTFTHDTFKQYDSMETGFYYDFKIKSVSSTNHRIDLIVITDSLVTKIWHENIKIYLRP
jgi:hypothetical protein